MPAISKIRLTNVVYEEGNKRYHDETFMFDGHNGAIVLENGGGKTVLIHTALQAIFPHVDLADRKIKQTLVLDQAPAHIAIEWIDHDQPRRYVVTAVTLFMTKHGLDSVRYVYEYDEHNPNRIEDIPFTKETKDGTRVTERGEIVDYYSQMKEKSLTAKTFQTIKAFREYIEDQYHIIQSEWESIVKINSTEGGVEAFFDECKTTNQLFDRLLIPTVEDAIEGHDKAAFSDLFFKQQDGLKEYKRLKETIEETKDIEQALTVYTKVYEQLHQSETAYTESKQQTKGVYLHAKSNAGELEKALTDNNQHMDVLKQDQRTLSMKEKSLEIQRKEYDQKQLKEAVDTLLEQQASLESKREKIKKTAVNLDYANVKQLKKTIDEELAYIEDQLRQLDRSDEQVDLEEKLTERKGALRGYYLTLLEDYEKELTGLTHEQQPLERELERLKQKQVSAVDDQKTLNQQITEAETLIRQREEDLDHIKQDILSQPNEAVLKEEVVNWQQEEVALDESIVDNKTALSQLKKDDLALKEEEKLTRDTLAEALKQATIWQEKKETIETKEQVVIDQLAATRHEWKRLRSLYEKEASIYDTFTHLLYQQREEKERLIEKERLSYRYVDFYQHQTRFFADPVLHDAVEKWKVSFSYIETGVEFISRLEDAERASLTPNYLWPEVIVTQQSLKEQVKRKIVEMKDRLIFPVTVLSTEEALQQNQQVEAIQPAHWEENLDEAHFTDWKTELISHAKTFTARRKEKERDIERIEAVYRQFTQFIEDYPFDAFKDVTEQLQEATKQVSQQKQQLKTIETKREQVLRKVTQREADVYQAEKKLDFIHQKLIKGRQGLSYEEVIKEKKAELKTYISELNEVDKRLVRLTETQARLEEEKRQLGDRMLALKTTKQMVENSPDFINVKNEDAIYTDDSEAVIKRAIYDLELQLNQFNSTRNEWELKAKHAKEKRTSYEQAIENMKKDYGALDETVTFPVDGERYLQQLKEEINTIDDALVDVSRKLKQQEAALNKAIGHLESDIDAFKQLYQQPPLNLSDEELNEAILEEEKHALSKRETYLVETRQRLDKEKAVLDEAISLLERFIEAHHFNGPDIEEYKLTPKEQTDFGYQPVEWAKRLTDELNKRRERLEQTRDVQAQEKNTFRSFCLKHVSNVQLQHMAINGIDTKVTYDDVMTFKQNMLTKIQLVSKYAHEHMRQYDEDLKMFINQMATHIITVVEELSQIPKKTRMKVDDHWKQIFTFKLPEWDEQSGKAHLREHIEWILDKVAATMTDETDEASSELKKKIRHWLETKQLLRVVFGDQTMKVRLAKVTNDNRVTTRTYTWEESNVWSGGEKWSKNMTLFLGLLNYVAEKKKHIEPSAKRHRSVILDNPFGKASSDHVLSPVFFIAEQLGFQLIALTAHAEGKFLEDYFPIIYSCRLRATNHPGKQMVQKEKWLHPAYFKDHEPDTMDRVLETKQLDLFDE